MNPRHALSTLARTSLIVLATTVMSLIGGRANAQLLDQYADTTSLNSTDDAAALVGVYDLERTFRALPQSQAIEEAVQSAQMEMQAAQQSGDQMKMQQIQQEFQETRHRLTSEFEQTVRDVMPAVARAHGIKVAATHVVYTDESIGTTDLTDDLISAFNTLPDDVSDDHSNAGPAITVGTYDADQVFRAHPIQVKLAAAMEAAKWQLQQAQQSGDRQMLQQIQMELQQTRNVLIGDFEADVSAAMTDVARETGVDVAAMQVVYTAADVTVKDITNELIGALGDSAGASTDDQ